MFKRTKVCTALMGAFGGGLLMAVAPASAQDASAQGLQRVEITGSALKRIDAETALPVTVMTREEIARSGAQNMEQLVASISSSSSAGNTTASQTAGLATYGLSSISLRGLGEQRTLVLVNGRRLAVFAGGGTGGAVDINAIPLAAIERVEVLRDGASALYGSDAVAGVVNFILRKDYKGIELTAEYGTPSQEGGGQVARGSVLFGTGDIEADGFNIMAGIDLERSRALFATQRDFSSSGNRPPYFENAATPSGRIEGIWDPKKFVLDGNTWVNTNARDGTTNPFGISGSGYGNPFAPDKCAQINMFPAAGQSGAGGGKYNNCLFDSAPFVGLFPAVERTSLFGTVKAKLSNDVQFYGEGLYARTRMSESYQPSPVRGAFLDSDLKFFDKASNPNGVAPVLLIYPNNPAYQSIVSPYLQANGLAAMDGKPLGVTLRTFLTGPRTEIDTNEQMRLIGGLRGGIGSWDFDVAGSYNRATTSGRVVDGYFSQFGLASVLNDPNSNWNPWAAGGAQDAALTEKLQSTKYVGPTISGISTAYSLDATASTSLMDLPAGPLQLAVGSALRRETYVIKVPAILDSGDIAGLGGATQSEDDSRLTYAVFSELNAPVVKGLEVSLSGRFDHYSDVGSTTNGKLSARWTPISSVLLRGAVGTGFRAPTLVELHQPQTIGTSEQFVDPLHVGDGAIQSNALIGGNPELKPEKSKQASLGIVVSPVRGFTASADWFLIKIDDYITQPSALALIAGVRSGKPLYGPDDATFFPDGTVNTVNQINRNAASAFIKGVDVNVNWTDSFSFGKLSADLSGTYMTTFDLETLAGTQHSVGTIIQPDGSPLDVASLGVVSRWKHTLSLNWTAGPWSTTLAQSFYQRYRDANNQVDGAPHYVPSTATYDAQVAFAGVKDLKVTLGMKNLFNKRPPIFIGNGSSFQYGYDPANNDPRGRFAYLTVNYKFF